MTSEIKIITPTSKRDKKRFLLYPVAIVLHTGMDFIAALSIFNVISLSVWALKGIVAAFGSLTFLGAYLLLYKKDVRKEY